jgi:carbon-monoxide dehydrogenase medium subunit
MFPASTNYERPERIEEAVSLLSQQGADARVLAGGQSLLPLLKARRIAPNTLVDIAALKELREISPADKAFTVGALVTQAELIRHKDLRRTFPLLEGDIEKLIDPIICKRGTFVGSLAMADPGGDWPAIALALDVSLQVQGSGGDRTLPISGFFQDSFSTVLNPSDLITHAILPVPEPGAKMAYRKFPHPASGYALVGVAALVESDSNGRCSNCRVAVTGAGKKPTRVKAAEDALSGEPLTEESIDEAVLHGSDDVEPLSDVHAGREYRSMLIGVYLRRALQDLMHDTSRNGTAVH